jgi:hypothetical protein
MTENNRLTNSGVPMPRIPPSDPMNFSSVFVCRLGISSTLADVGVITNDFDDLKRDAGTNPSAAPIHRKAKVTTMEEITGSLILCDSIMIVRSFLLVLTKKYSEKNRIVECLQNQGV